MKAAQIAIEPKDTRCHGMKRSTRRRFKSARLILPCEPPPALARMWRTAVRWLMAEDPRGQRVINALWAIELRWRKGVQ